MYRRFLIWLGVIPADPCPDPELRWLADPYPDAFVRNNREQREWVLRRQAHVLGYMLVPRADVHFPGPDSLYAHNGKIEDCQRSVCKAIVARGRASG
jgi:hypothetical protein